MTNTSVPASTPRTAPTADPAASGDQAVAASNGPAGTSDPAPLDVGVDGGIDADIDAAVGRPSDAASNPGGDGPDDDDSVDDRSDDDDLDEDGEDEGSTGRSSGGDSELFHQSEIAADYVEGLLDILDYDGDIDELVSGGRPVVEVVGGRLQALVGQRGATLEALQELTRLAVFRRTGSPSRLLLDVGGYRAGRRKELAAVAKNAVEKVKEFGEPVRLEPMSAFERKCVHDVVNALAGVESESEGVEPNRRIVVRPTD